MGVAIHNMWVSYNLNVGDAAHVLVVRLGREMQFTRILYPGCRMKAFTRVLEPGTSKTQYAGLL